MLATTLDIHSPVPWKDDLKVTGVLGLLAALATAALFPYLMQMMPERFAAIPVPLPVLIVAQAMQALLVMGLLALLGLRMGHRVALGAPLLHGWLNRRRTAQAGRQRPLLAMAIGLGTAALIILASLLIDPLLPAMRNPPAATPAGHAALNGFLASFYGGIAEELQLRLFLMSLLVWVVASLRKRMPRAATYWVAIVLAALMFGAGHLPAASQVWGLDAVVVSRTIALNAIAGIACGWLYWRQGLEMAIVAHFSADLVLHVLLPLTGISMP